MFDQASTDTSRRWAGALDGDKVLYGSGDEGNIGVAAYLPIDILGDDENEATPREGKVNTRDTHSSDVVAFKVLRGKALRLGLAHGYVAPKLDPDVADLGIRPLVESDSDTAGVDGGNLARTQGERLHDDCLVARDVRRLVFIVDKDIDSGGHDGSYWRVSVTGC